MTEELKKLLNCPFCEGNPISIEKEARVICLGCFASMPAGDEGWDTNIDSAKNKWNTRAPRELTQREEKLVEEMGAINIKGGIGLSIKTKEQDHEETLQELLDIGQQLREAVKQACGAIGEENTRLKEENEQLRHLLDVLDKSGNLDLQARVIEEFSK